VFKFADDTKIFRCIKDSMDLDMSRKMQKDMDTKNYIQWADKWQMEFTVSKWKVIHVGKTTLRNHTV